MDAIIMGTPKPYLDYTHLIRIYNVIVRSRQMFKVDKNIAPQVPLKYAILGLTSLP